MLRFRLCKGKVNRFYGKRAGDVLEIPPFQKLDSYVRIWQELSIKTQKSMILDAVDRIDYYNSGSSCKSRDPNAFTFSLLIKNRSDIETSTKELKKTVLEALLDLFDFKSDYAFISLVVQCKLDSLFKLENYVIGLLLPALDSIYFKKFVIDAIDDESTKYDKTKKKKRKKKKKARKSSSDIEEEENKLVQQDEEISFESIFGINIKQTKQEENKRNDKETKFTKKELDKDKNSKKTSSLSQARDYVLVEDEYVNKSNINSLIDEFNSSFKLNPSKKEELEKIESLFNTYEKDNNGQIINFFDMNACFEKKDSINVIKEDDHNI